MEKIRFKLDDLPGDILNQLVCLREKEKEREIKNAILLYKGHASVDEILVGLYRNTGKVFKRVHVVNILGKLVREKRGVVSVSARRGIYQMCNLKEQVGE